MPQITLTDIFIYPIKGLQGIRLEKAEVLSAGLKNDRRWMLVDESGTFLSQRSLPKMAEFETRLTEEQLHVSFRGESVDLPFELSNDDKIKVSVWKSKLNIPEASPELSAWFSDKMGTTVKLVYKPDEIERKRRFYVPPYLSPVSLADGYPLLVLGTASVEYLNDKLDEPITADRFRANLIFETTVPHEEDKWAAISLSDSKLKVIKPCARCMVVNIDQKSGQQFMEPLKTLATYRKKVSKVMFGANTVVLKEGRIRVGETLKFISDQS